MSAEHDRTIADIPRDRLEEMLIRTVSEVRRLRQTEIENRQFGALVAGVVAGAVLATAAFLLVVGLG